MALVISMEAREVAALLGDSKWHLHKLSSCKNKTVHAITIKNLIPLECEVRI